MLEFSFRSDRRREEPVYRQLTRYLRGLVEGGRLSPGEKLPATRDLAEQLRLSRNTVSHAYEALVDEGFATARVGRGTFVSVLPPRAPQDVRSEHDFVWDGLLSARVERMELPGRPVGPPRGVALRFDFTGGRIDSDLLPASSLRRSWSQALASDMQALEAPLDAMGWRPLREAIARSLVARGILCSASEVLVVSGAQQALDLVARVLVDPGDVVAVEQPGYFGAALAFSTCGAQLVGIPVDEQGLRTDELARQLRSRRVKLVYTTPSAQCPTGAVLSEARRAELHALSDRYQVPIVEDDYDSELRYSSPPVPALKTTDAAGRVVYVGTFSKALFPGLRIGYVVAARPLLQRLATARFASDFGSDTLAQLALTELISSGVLERHVRRMRRAHSLRRAAILEALERCMPEGAKWTRPSGGHSVLLTLPSTIDPDALAARAGAAGISYVRASSFYFKRGPLDASVLRSIVLSFVHKPEALLHEGIAELGRQIKESRTGQ